MHFGPWEIAAFVGLWTGAFLLAADVGLRIAPNIRAKLPKLEKIQESGWWGFTPLILLTMSGAIFLANALGVLPAKQNGDLSGSWQFLAPVVLLGLVFGTWAVRRIASQKESRVLVAKLENAPGTGLPSPAVIKKQIEELRERVEHIDRNTTRNNQKIVGYDRDIPVVLDTMAEILALSVLFDAVRKPPDFSAVTYLTDEELKAEIQKAEDYSNEVRRLLGDTQWGMDVRSIISSSDGWGEQRLRELPADRRPKDVDMLDLRAYMIARTRAERLWAFVHSERIEARSKYVSHLDFIKRRSQDRKTLDSMT